MKNLDTVLRQKEDDVERVRREIQALLLVVPLLADDQPGSEDRKHERVFTASKVADTSDNGMADLELYYPFVKHLVLKQRR